jgi:serine/threonine-protein kinase
LPHAWLEPLTQRFELYDLLGHGGMGVVFKARDRETNEIIALKVLKPEVHFRAELMTGLMERFKTEVRLARKITHVNVCRTYDLHRFGAVAAIAMEFVPGQSLRLLLRQSETLSIRHGLKIIRQVIAGLAEAHRHDIVHRDLKPENIMVDQDGSVKIMDFGIARIYGPASAPCVGTPAYMAPEQTRGGARVDQRTDIYALGLILYEMLTGRPAFQAAHMGDMLALQIHVAPAPPRSVEPTIPPFIEATIMRCLEKDPTKRFQSVQELQAALHAPVEMNAPAAAEPTQVNLPIRIPKLYKWDWESLYKWDRGSPSYVEFRIIGGLILIVLLWRLYLWLR